jgi:beta-fructofuranosidase
MAVSHDDLQTFTKPPVNRLNILPPKGEKLEGFRDPCVWQEKDGWYMLIGSGFAGKGGAALLYRSTNFLDWDFLDPLLETSDDRLGTMWECPNFFPMGDRHVLIVSAAPKGYAHYFTGQYKDHYLMPGRDGVVDYGGYLYAPQVFKDSHDRFILFGWVWEGLSKEARLAAGWAGVQSLPRELFLSPEGMLCNRPVSEVAQLRGESFSLKELQLPANSVYPLSFGGECLEIDVIFSIDAGICGVYLACSDDDREKTIVGYDLNDRSVFIDCNQSSMSPDVQRGVHKAQLVLPTHETLRLHIFLDRSVIEIFVNDRLSMTSRIYPTLESSHRVRLFSKGIGVTVKSLDIWRMNDIGM